MITLQHLLGLKRSVLRKHWNRLFHTPNIRSTIPLVRIWALLYLCCSAVVGCRYGVNKYVLWPYPLSSSSSPLCCPLWNWAHKEELRKILESWVAPFQRATMFENSKLGVHTLIDGKPVLTVPVLLSIRSWWTLNGNMTSIYTANHSWEVPIFIELHFIVGLPNSIRELDVKTPGCAECAEWMILKWAHMKWTKKSL